jgi:hypothetical protein
MQKHTCNRNYFENIDTEEKAYWLGFIIADGCISKNQVIINLQHGDIGHLVKLQYAIAGTQEPHIYEGVSFGKKHKFAKIAVSSTKMVKDFKKHGVSHRKSKYGFQLWQGPNHLLQHYYRGLFDGDGWIFQSGKRQYWQVGFCGFEHIVKNFALFVRLKSLHKIKNSLWSVNTMGIKKAREVIFILYTGATVALDRKLVLVKNLLKAKTQRDVFEKYYWITPQHLSFWYKEYNSWKKVETAIGINRGALRKIRINLMKPSSSKQEMPI